ncbi:MAG: 50S ribosomal protein L35 [Deferrisomatales bacterium]
MPKLKTNRAAAKRFKITARGKVKHRKANRSHILGGKARKRKRHLRGPGYVDDTNLNSVRQLLPYM